MEIDYKKIVAHYEQCFLQHGDNHKGVDWPNQSDLNKRFQVAYDVTKKYPAKNCSILDFGCGNGLFIDYLTKHHLLEQINYTGLDLSNIFISCCKKKYPDLSFLCYDVLHSSTSMSKYDYIIMNGVLTEKRSLSFAAMWNYTQNLLNILFQHCNIGLCFNLMSHHVDWQREDLFHVPFDLLAEFLQKNLSRNYLFRNDYGLYEFTTYVYR